MTIPERDRLGLALAVSLVVHAVAFLIVEFGDWRVAPLPEFTGPMYVEMAPVERPEPEPETDGLARSMPAERLEPEPEPEPAPEPEPRTPSQPEPEPAPSPGADQGPAEQRAEAARDGGAASEAEPSARSGEPVRDFSAAELHGQEARPGTRTAPEPDDSFDPLPPAAADTRPDVTEPEWVRRPRETVADAGLSTEGITEGEVQDLAEKVATDPAFRRQLQEVSRALEERTTAGDGGAERAPAEEPDTAPDTQQGPTGDDRFEWVGTGNRELMNPPAVSRSFFTSADFGGQVPAEAAFVVVFEVGPDGNVLPGSVLFQQGGGYVNAREKLRGRVRTWQFEPAPAGADVATGIFTLVVRREDIR